MFMYIISRGKCNITLKANVSSQCFYRFLAAMLVSLARTPIWHRALQICVEWFSNDLTNGVPHRPETWRRCLFINLL